LSIIKRRDREPDDHVLFCAQGFYDILAVIDENSMEPNAEKRERAGLFLLFPG
jgi:hypothetical protein